MLAKLVRSIMTFALVSQTLMKRNIEYKIKRIVGGIALLFASWILGLLGIIGGIASLFFALSDVSRFTYPFAISGGISILLAIIVGIEGIRLLKK